ncbi:serine/threonine-protein kinase [Streptosporangium sp. KLBMP 9127]|nr:serine/threonine protein kinase [Streptosporangium sp. KLBMP 9127]
MNSQPRPPSDDATAAQRRTIGPYTPIRRLGEGGMGIVYLSRDTAGRQVALKVLRPELASREEFRQRFRKEAEAARKVARSCTAAVLDVGMDGDQAYIATEYVEGATLSAVVEAQGPMVGSNLDALAVGVATALSAIHRAGIVHRDLKPSNILLSPVGPRVIDFGIAQLADTIGGDIGKVVGTPLYMPPEQARGELVTAAADVFAWGCVVAYAATGRPPFGGGATPGVLYRVANYAPDLDGLAERLRPLVERALAKDPARRPSTQQLLDSLLGQEEVAPETATRVVSEIWTPLDLASPVAPPAQRRWLVPVLAVVTALALAAAALSFALRLGTPGGSGQSGNDRPSRDLQIDGINLHFEIIQLTRKGQGITLEWSVRNVGSQSWNPWTAFGLDLPSRLHYNTTAGVTLVDPATGKKYGPMIEGDTCTCSPTKGDLSPGDTAPYFSVFAGVPETVEQLSVQIPSAGLFADVPIS